MRSLRGGTESIAWGSDAPHADDMTAIFAARSERARNKRMVPHRMEVLKVKKILLARAFLALGLASGAALEVWAQAPSLLPIPQASAAYGVQPAAFKRFQAEEAGSGLAPANGTPAEPLPVQNGDSPFTPYEQAMGGAWGDGGLRGTSSLRA